MSLSTTNKPAAKKAAPKKKSVKPSETAEQKKLRLEKAEQAKRDKLRAEFLAPASTHSVAMIAGRKIELGPYEVPGPYPDDADRNKLAALKDIPCIKARDCEDEYIDFQAPFETFMLAMYQVARSAGVPIPPVPEA